MNRVPTTPGPTTLNHSGMKPSKNPCTMELRGSGSTRPVLSLVTVSFLGMNNLLLLLCST